MGRWLRQTVAVLALSVRTIPSRLSSSAVAIVGIAGVVVVFVSVLSIAAGFAAAMQGSGSPGRAIVMRSGADSEMTSGLEGPDVDIIKQAPGINRDGRGTQASAELYVIIDLPKKAIPDKPANVPMRGIEPTGMTVRQEASIGGDAQDRGLCQCAAQLRRYMPLGYDIFPCSRSGWGRHSGPSRLHGRGGYTDYRWLTVIGPEVFLDPARQIAHRR